MKRIALIAWLLAAGSVTAQPLGGAFLDTGLGASSLGMGGAVSASVDGPEAIFYNPAGLSSRQGRSLLASYQPMSLDRTRTGLAGSINVRGPLAFGLAWLHASTGGLLARNGSGEIVDGDLTDGSDAILFALGMQATPTLQLGLGVKILDQRIDAPQVGESTASGRSVDLGARYRVGSSTTVSLVWRNLANKLNWSIVRPSAQTGTSDEALLSMLAFGAAHRHGDRLRAGIDVEWLDPGGSGELRAHGGVEARLSPLLSVRAGVHRLGDADGTALPTFGLSLRPMRIEALQIDYAWVADDLDAGGRTVLTVGSRF